MDMSYSITVLKEPLTLRTKTIITKHQAINELEPVFGILALKVNCWDNYRSLVLTYPIKR